jgi:hypothetical protein
MLIAFVVACGSDRNPGSDDHCAPTCWQNSPGQATSSAEQVEAWAEQCKAADAGCPGRYCAVTRLEFRNAPEVLRYSVQCESGVPDDRYCQYVIGEFIADHAWLGPDYGLLGDKNVDTCEQGINDGWRVTGWAYPVGGPAAQWTPEKIEDALAHDVTSTPCEEIADLRSCIRAFIPPDIHCTPEFDKSTNEYLGCGYRQEPFNRPINWRDVIKD